MDWNYGLNTEGNEEEFQYVINLLELGSEDYSTDKLLEEVKQVVGEDNVHCVQDGMYFIYTQDEEHINQLDEICKRYEDIFYEEYENL